MSRGGGGRPTAGHPWTAQEDTDLESIAAEVYGDPGKAGLIWGANKSRKTNVVRKGEHLILPGNVLAPETLSGKQPNDLTVIVSGIELKLTGCRIVRTMDTGADGWSGLLPWNPGENPAVDAATKPFGYQRTSVYIGGILQVNGHLYTISPSLTTKGRVKELMGYSHTVDMVDSHVQPPYERNNITLESLAREMMHHRGITTVFETPSGGAFARTTGHESDTVFSHLSKLATERGILVSNTAQGDLLFHRAKTSGTPVGTLREGEPGVLEWKAVYDGRKRFNAYKCISAGTGKAVAKWGEDGAAETPAVTFTEIDPQVPLSRFMSFRADDTTPGNVQVAARWQKNKQFVEALTFALPVDGWYAPNGKLWETNTLLTVESVTLGVPKGFTFLIRQVEFILEDKRYAVLQLVPPQAFSGKDIGEVWQ